MSESDFAITSSGTATLELALHQTPQIVVYKTSALSFAIGKKLVDLKFISLVNLISDKAIVPELIQNDLTIDNLEKEFQALSKIEKRQSIVKAYENIRLQLGSGDISNKIASDIYNKLKH